MLFTKKKIILDCFTDSSSAFYHASPRKAIKCMPDWWKKLPQQTLPEGGFFPNTTMKRCDGLIALYKEGIILPMWSDLAMKVGEINTDDFEWQFADYASEIQLHPPEQSNNFIDPYTVVHIKIKSPWHFTTNEDVLWHWNDVFWDSIPLSRRVCPGVVSFKHQHATHINILIKRDIAPKVETIKFLEPLVHFIPVSDRPVVIRKHLVSHAEFNQLQNIKAPATFTCMYEKLKKAYAQNLND